MSSPDLAPPRPVCCTRPSAAVTVVLGPTNTGKTHLAIDRMTGYGSGLIGFRFGFLRARIMTVWLRALVSKVGLVTGEERILPPSARYICATVESMPLERNDTGTKADFLGDQWVNRGFEFVVVDEVQFAETASAAMSSLTASCMRVVSSRQC